MLSEILFKTVLFIYETRFQRSQQLSEQQMREQYILAEGGVLNTFF